MKGRKNCEVIGIMSNVVMPATIRVLTSGGKLWFRYSEPAAIVNQNKCCRSYSVHRCANSFIIVFVGSTEVCREANDEAGDCRLRILEASFRRRRCGIRRGSVGLEKEGLIGDILVWRNEGEGTEIASLVC